MQTLVYLEILQKNGFLGDLVGGEHFGNKGWLANGAGFDKKSCI